MLDFSALFMLKIITIIISVCYVKESAVDAAPKKTSGSMTRVRATPEGLVSPFPSSRRGRGRSKGKILLDFFLFIRRLWKNIKKWGGSGSASSLGGGQAIPAWDDINAPLQPPL
jgi:hypothetical protein